MNNRKHIKYFEQSGFLDGDIYNYWDLPRRIRMDIDNKIEYDIYDQDDYTYTFKILNIDDLEKYLRDRYDNFEDVINHVYVNRLIEEIEVEGIDIPLIGLDGNHMALAYYIMKEPLAYFEINLKTGLE